MAHERIPTRNSPRISSPHGLSMNLNQIHTPIQFLSNTRNVHLENTPSSSSQPTPIMHPIGVLTYEAWRRLGLTLENETSQPKSINPYHHLEHPVSPLFHEIEEIKLEVEEVEPRTTIIFYRFEEFLEFLKVEFTMYC